MAALIEVGECEKPKRYTTGVIARLFRRSQKRAELFKIVCPDQIHSGSHEFKP